MNATELRLPIAGHLTRLLSSQVPAVVLGLAGGWVIATGNITLAGLGAVTVMAIGLCVVYPSLLLWGTIAGGLVLAGLTQLYLPQFQALRWVVGTATIGLGAVAALHWLLAQGPQRGRDTPELFWWFAAFFLFVALSTAVNRTDAGTLVFGVKGYTQVWGLALALAMLPFAAGVTQRLPFALLAIALLQLPFVAHQFLFLAPARVNIGNGVVPEDVIAGTFGASALGGGANAALSSYLFLVIGVLASLWKERVVSGRFAMLTSLVLLVPTVLNMSKISAVYLGLVLFVLFLDELRRRPLVFFAGSAVAGLMMAAIAAIFIWMSADTASRELGWPAMLERAQQKFLSEEAGYGSLELNRMTAITFWAEQHGLANLPQTLIGHGLGQSREGEGGIGLASTLAERSYAGMGIGLTAVSAMLWDLGLIGTAFVFALFVRQFQLAGRLAELHADDRFLAAVLKGLRAGVAVLLLGLFHKNFFVRHLPYQTIVILVFGFIAFWEAKARAQLGTLNTKAHGTEHP